MIKPHLWPQIEFFSSRGQGSWHLCVIQQQPFNPCRILMIWSKSQSHIHSRGRDYTKMWTSGGKNHWKLFLIMLISAYLPARDFFIYSSLDKCLLSVLYMADTWDAAVKQALGRGSCWQWAAMDVTLRTLALLGEGGSVIGAWIAATRGCYWTQVWLLATQKPVTQEASVSRKESCFNQKSQPSGEEVDSCLETNSHDSAQPGHFKGKKNEARSLVSHWGRRLGSASVFSACRLVLSLSLLISSCLCDLPAGLLWGLLA